MILENNSKLVMIGDSITDAERVRPIGNPWRDSLGKGYVNLVNALLLTSYPQSNIAVYNMGCSGNTVTDLQERWQTDVLDLKPDWLSIMIGINDVWRHFDMPAEEEKRVPLERYETVLEELISTTKPTLKGGLILLTPYYIEPNKDEPMRKMMDSYGAVVKKLAQKYDALFVDTQAAFDEALQVYNPTFLAWDRVHPPSHGHMIIARAFLKAIGFEF